MTRPLLTIVLGLVLAAGAAGGAQADGLPVLGLDAAEGVATTDGSARYVARPSRGGTFVAQVTRDGAVPQSMLLGAIYAVPVVAYDGTPGGLSANGRTLVLLEPRARFPRKRTTLAVLDTRPLGLRTLIHLRGDFSFDAISPAGDLLYLIQYTSAKDPTRYAVRVYDVAAGRLRAAPVVDPHERGEAMRGSPITRYTSPDGRWAYTLYDGAGMEPFVHALDTRDARARCIDLPMLEGRQDLNALKLDGRGPGGDLRVLARGRPLALIDTRSFRVARLSGPTSTEGGGRPWSLVGAGIGAALVAAGLLAYAIRRRRRPLLAVVEGEGPA
jgi:hypothetical protein